MAAEMSVADFKRRIQRLEKLPRGFSLEVGRWKGAADPLFFRERKAYLGAVQDALAGVEAARVVLAKVLQRMEGWGGFEPVFPRWLG